IVRHVEPLVRIGRPGIGAINAIQQMSILRTSRSPETKRAVNMNPSVLAARSVTDFADWIARTGIHVANLRANNRRPIYPRNFGRFQSSLRIGGNGLYLICSKTEQRQSF